MIKRIRATLLLGASLGLASLPASAFAQEAPPRAEAQPESEIIVTGTRRTDRTVADSPVPIDVIGSEAITETGYTETNKILNQLCLLYTSPSPRDS